MKWVVLKQKTTRRWFHDTAYCFDYSAFIPMVPGVGLEPTQRERRGILNRALFAPLSKIYNRFS